MARLLLCTALIFVFGCGNPPNAEQNAAARQTTITDPDPPLLEQREMNEMLKASQDGGTTDVYLNKIYRVAVEVVATKITKDSSDPEGHGRIRLIGRPPENVAIGLECFFADADENKVENLKPHQMVRLRGQLSSIADRRIEFTGCILEPE